MSKPAIFYDVSTLCPTPGIEARATDSYLRCELEKRFPSDALLSVTVTENSTGAYRGPSSFISRFFGAGKEITDLPPYYEAVIRRSTGKYSEEIIVWCPKAWNGRFAGTANGGTCTGGRTAITDPGEYQRGWTLPYALRNGFTAATAYAGNADGLKDYIIDSKTGAFNRELYDNWRLNTTHSMTLYGKAVAEILHGRRVEYSYMNGGSGGGRQCLMEAQNFPEDYDGIWASCPAINWHSFITAGLWPQAVMNEYNRLLTPEKNAYLSKRARDMSGGDAAFYSLKRIPDADAARFVGENSPGGVITEEDALIMNEIWTGPCDEDGTPLWYACAPGVVNWQKYIPIGTYYYPLFYKITKRTKPFLLGTKHARWITGEPDNSFKTIKKQDVIKLLRLGEEKLSDCQGNNPDLTAFMRHGGKLMIDHGTDDPLIPCQGTLDYYEKLLDFFGEKERLDSFVRLYITPGDNHGNCIGNGPGLTQTTCIRTMLDWVENGKAPGELPTVRVNKKTYEIIGTGTVKPE